MSEELKPCPFCGSADARVFNRIDDDGWFSYGVQCSGSECSICGPERGNEVAAREVWNRCAAPVAAPLDAEDFAEINLPPLPPSNYMAHVHGYTAEQVRQAQRDAVVASRQEIGLLKVVIEQLKARAAEADAYIERLEAGVIDARRAAVSTTGDAPADPMDWPIPCDVKVGAGTIKKGCKLRTLVVRMESLHRMAMGAFPKVTPEQRAQFEALIAAPQSPTEGAQ